MKWREFVKKVEEIVGEKDIETLEVVNDMAAFNSIKFAENGEHKIIEVG